ncbi:MULTISPECIES: M20 family metallo-hydrolase [Bacteria]|uniref:M20 family metallo-hydrolase n=1 Tax=Lysinibacillus fusiformis TaxID=28031 RepID=UPI001EF4CBAD|nr:M20 family metallo-hydrolase [Lysinibacillus fusiformis]MCG7434561.1 M20 family metallo-hydrolase [Lysinibacillus fusiformis]
MVGKERYQQLLNKMNQYNSGEKGITRVAYTNEEQACLHAFIRLCKDEHLQIHIDPCGNLIARREGKVPGLQPVVMGSHLDTVYQGGKYDGVVGVTAALEVIKRLNEKSIVTKHPIEIIAFACEESSRFGVSTVGSKAMAGLIDKEKYRHLVDRDGISMEQAFAHCGLDFSSVDQANRAGEGFHAFFELHIEQGPMLISYEKKIGIVTGVAAPVRLLMTLNGKASHSGTTPMNMRKDALLGASELALELEKAAIAEQEFGTVATVGILDVVAGSMNVVPGQVELTVDIRSSSVQSRDRVLQQFYTAITNVQQKRLLAIDYKVISSEEPVLLSHSLMKGLESICIDKNLSYQYMQSGAGHDSMNMIRLGPVGLIFIPSVDGLSHHPDEHTDLEDILLGIEVLEEAVLRSAIII